MMNCTLDTKGAYYRGLHPTGLTIAKVGLHMLVLPFKDKPGGIGALCMKSIIDCLPKYPQRS